MEIIYAALILHKANKEITEESIQKVLGAADIKVDVAQVKALIAALDGVDIEQAIKEAAVAPVASSHVEAGQPVEEKKEEKEEEKKADEESAAQGLAGLFG